MSKIGQILDVRAWFKKYVSDDLQWAIIKKVQGGNRDAAVELRTAVKEGKYTRQIARDLFPHQRRARIESCLLDLGTEFPEIQATSQLNSNQSQYHTRLKIGSVMLTASAVSTPKGLVRETEFRNNYAGPQLRADIDRNNNLLPVTMQDVNDDELLYGIILYCPSEKNRLEISGIRVGFPNRYYTGYLDCPDLIGAFLESMKKTEIEEVQDQANVSLLLEHDLDVPTTPGILSQSGINDSRNP